MFNTFRYTCKGKIQKIKELKMQTPRQGVCIFKSSNF